MWQCPKCGLDNPDSSSFCSNCGFSRSKKARPISLQTALIATAIVAVLGLAIWASQTVWHKHKWGDWAEVTPATCESVGREIRICKSNSSHVEEQEIPALGHDWGDWTVETEPDCETAGTEVRTCKNDPTHQERREIAPLGHDWVEATTEAPKTCRRCGTQVGDKIKTEYDLFLDSCYAYDPSVEVPIKSEMLDQTVTLYVVGAWPNSPSGGMWMCKSPGENGIVVLKPHTPVTVHAVRGNLALKDGYAFVETSSGEYGWVNFKASRGTGVGLTDTNDFSYSD